MIAGYRQLIARAHETGIKIFGATILPYKGALSPSNYYTLSGDAVRQAINDFIRQSGEFDGVIDFDKATRDPANPLQLLPAYDSGDHLHPNDVGYQAMANAVDLELFRIGDNH
jgi:lysophospholipase L1-like esterase